MPSWAKASILRKNPFAWMRSLNWDVFFNVFFNVFFRIQC